MDQKRRKIEKMLTKILNRRMENGECTGNQSF